MQNCTTVDESLHSLLGQDGPGFVAKLLPQLMELVRSSRRLPLGEEHSIRRGSSDFLTASQELGDRSLANVHRALRWVDPNSHKSTQPEDLLNFNLVVDGIDNVLEKVDDWLRDSGDGRGELNKDSMGDRAAASSAQFGAAMIKPQTRWQHLTDNHRSEFVPRLLAKFNASSPLPARILEAQARAGLRAEDEAPSMPRGRTESDPESSELLGHLSSMGVAAHGEGSLPNPYSEELSAPILPPRCFDVKPPELYRRMEDCPLVWVRNAEELMDMILEIQGTCSGKEIAVDIEHHDYRTYRGFVCLMQISTRQKDFLIDPFDIFEDLHALNQIFTDPSIVKVFHGADRDIIWLQRDFSVYVVNMFDTGQAARQLKLRGGFSLANLITQLCGGLKLDKKHQTSDWRVRPLLPEMAEYARCDTHYLLYCYDRVRNMLLTESGDVPTGGEKGIVTEAGKKALTTVLEKSTALCRVQYSEEPLNAGNVAMKLSERFDSKQKPMSPNHFSALQALIKWRDNLAREEDESIHFISPDACLWRIARTLPGTVSQLRSSCNPLPAVLQQRADEVVDLLKGITGDSGSAPSSAKDAGSAAALPADSVESRPAMVSKPGRPAGQKSPPEPAACSTASKVPRKPWPDEKKYVALKPIVHLSSGRKRPSNGGFASLKTFFDSDPSGDERDDDEEDNDEFDIMSRSFNKMKDIRKEFKVTVAPVAPAKPAVTQEKKKDEEIDADAEGHDDFLRALGVKDERAEAAAAAKSLRETHTVKKKRKVAVLTQSAGLAAAEAAYGAEAAATKPEAIAGDAADGVTAPPKKKLKRRKVVQASASAATVADDDPYATLWAAADQFSGEADPYAAPLAEQFGLAASELPSEAPVKTVKKKLVKRKVVRTTPAPATDAYAMGDPYA